MAFLNRVVPSRPVSHYARAVDLTVSVIPENDGRSALVLQGALDLQSRDVLLDAARGAGDRPGMTGLVLDLREVSFMDSSGIGALVQLARASDDAGMTFALRAPSARVQRVLQVTGLADSWPIEPIEPIEAGA
jgi:anti-sigma B factor antagonist